MFEFNRSPLPVVAGLCVALLCSLNSFEWPSFPLPIEVPTMTSPRSTGSSPSVVQRSFAATPSSQVPTQQDAEVQLRALNRRYIETWKGKSVSASADLISNDFLLTDRRGNWLDRAAFLQETSRPVALRAVEPIDVRVRVFGQTALVHGVMVETAQDNTTARVRYTDVYARTNDRWYLVNSHHTALKPSVELTLRVSAPGAWSPVPREAPAATDAAELSSLNDNYVNAFRNANPAWYDAHLAPDYLVVYSDGSLNDRNTALANFARPVFSTRFQSFPVDKVRIRRLGDVALIHAENAYELKDGRKGIDRYTDIWHKQAGQWFCVAAHITTHRTATH
jgi:ketosteroid isomerase-like protein